jgi:SAM-dependent methyltransferase
VTLKGLYRDPNTGNPWQVLSNFVINVNDFYRQLTPLFHLIYRDWDATIEAQGNMLTAIIREEWGGSAASVLDVSCGIGTQSLALAARGFQVTASDVSEAVVSRARQEARARNLEINFSVCDMREAYLHHKGVFDVVLCAGNSLPHLLSDAEILSALKSTYASTGLDGGCIITMRQYDQEERGRGLLKPFGVREEDGRRTIIFQVWDFEGERYDFAIYFVEEDTETRQVQTHVMRSQYYAVSPDRVLELMVHAGFRRVHRLDDGVAHPAILVGTHGG